MKRKSIIVALLALWLILPIMAYAAPVGKFTSVEGNVDVTRLGKEAIPARLGDALSAGDVIRTKSKAKCEVAFIDGSILRLAESTRLRVGEFSQEREQRSATLNLFRGKIQNVVKTIAGVAATQSKYEIHTPTAVAGVRGTNFFVYHQAGISGAIFKEGTGYGYSLNRPQDVRTIKPGQAMVVVSADLPPTVRSATSAEMDQHQKDTAPAEKPKEEGKKEEEKKSDEAVAKADEGKKEEEKKEEKTEKDEAKTEQKAEEKPGEAKQTEKTAAEPQKVAEASATAATATTDVLTKSTLDQAMDFSSGSSGAGGTGTGVFPGTEGNRDGDTGKPEGQKPTDSLPQNLVPQAQDTIPPEIKLSLTPRIVSNAPVAAYALPSNARALFLSPGGSLEAVFLLLSPELSSFSYLQTDTNPDGTKTVGSWSSLSEPTKEFSFKLGNLTEGYHTFKITGTDASKNETTFEFTLSGLALERIAEAGAVFQITAKGPEEDSIKTVQIADAAGNVLSPASAPWVTEITASANVSIIAFFSSKPAAISNASSPTFTVASTKEGVSYHYSLDGTNYINATGNTIIPSGLKEGSNTLYIKATDQEGNVSSATSYTWTVDTVPPAITLTGTPAAITKANSANIGVSATDATAVTYTYKLDSNVVPSSDLTNIPEGSRVFTVVATDAAGNETTTTYSWATDYTPPVITLTGTPAAITKANSANIGVSATDATAVTYTYKLDSNVVPSSDLTNIPEGSRVFTVVATDAAGNETTTTYSWATDYTAPVAAIGTAASPDLSGAKLTSVTAAFSADESSTYSYSIDGGTLTSTGSSLTLSGLAEGSHTLSYTATDPAGNATTDSLTFSLSRYSLAGNVADLSGVTVGSVTAGEVAGVSNQDWGGWNISLGGSVEGPPPTSFTAAAGGRSTDTVTAGNDGGYWLESIEGTYDGVSALSGESALMYLSSDRVGGGYGAFTGSYSAASNTWQVTDSGAGAYSETPLAFGGGLSGAFFYHDYDSGLISENDITGLMGGIADLWTDSAPFAVMMGEYNNPSDRTLWGINATGASLSGAGYSGLIGGIALNGSLESMYIAIYIKPDGTTGYLTSNDVVGAFLPGIGMWVAEGSIASVPMGSTSVLPSELAVLPSYPYDGGPYRYGENHTVIAGDILGSYASGVTNFSATSLNDQNWGIWLWSGGGTYSSVSALPPNWKAVIGFAPGDNVYDPLDNYDFANAYGILNITGSSWSDNKLTGALDLTTSKILTPTTLTTFLTGDLLGTYDTTDNTWQAISGGAWSEKPLTFMSEVYPDRYNVVKEFSGAYNFSGGGYYYYTYNSDNSYGYKYSQSTSSGYPSTTTYYYSDGTTYTYSYDASGAYTTSSDTWDPQTFSLSSLATAPIPTDETAALAYQYENSNSNGIGDLYGIMGGTESLWYEADGTTINTTKTGVPVTVMGEYYHDADYATLGNNIWYTEDLYSSNYKDDTYTTYDGGAYQGFMGGIETPSLSENERTLAGGLIALYIDPAGNAGYLKGSLAGKAYPDIEMFEMDGLINRTQVATASQVGVSASDLTDSTHRGYMDVYGIAGQFMDGTTAAGSITGDYDYGDTLSIANWTTRVAQNWGIYGLTLYGKYDTPASTSWAARLGGDGDFGAYNLYSRYYGRYNYSNGDYYNYEYNNDNSYGYKEYYGSDGSYTYTYYYSDGETYTYNSSTGSSSYGTWDPSAFDLAGLATYPEPPAEVTVSLSDSHDYGSGDEDWGYWLAGINNGAAVDGKLTGEVTGRFITYTKLGTISGDLLGTYNATNTWEAVSLGKWSGAPLTFMSEVYPDRYKAVMYYRGSYNFSGGGYYNYRYYGDNSYGRSDSQSTSSYYPRTRTYYNSNGTTYTYSYDASGAYTTSSDTWDPQTFSLSSLATAPIPTGETAALAYQYENSDSNRIGALYGIMGGTQSLWYEADGTTINTTKTGVPVTVMGEYYHDAGYATLGNNIWYTEDLYSSNYKDDTYTTYDGGAYQGFMGGIETPSSVSGERTLEGGLIALYIDPAGNAGYLKGSLAGKAYPDIEMFEMDGLINRTQVATASQVGVSASDLTDSTHWGYMYVYGTAGQFMDGTTAAGSITGDYDYGDTLSIANWTTRVAQNWGIYGLTLYGKYDTPASTSWAARLGGDGDFGAYNLYSRYYGRYNYSNGDYYNYEYNNDNSYGYKKYYYGSDGSDTRTYYYSDGETYTYNSSTGSSSYGTWDPSAFDLAGLATSPAPPADVTVSLSYSYDYGSGDDDWGYWLAGINNGAAVDGKLTGEVTGRFITYTKLGTISGDLLGTYNSANTWEAVSLGKWSGAPLSFVSDASADLRATARYYEASYSYADGGYYSYNYYTDNHDGYVSYDRPGGSHYDTYYYDDGTTYTYDYNTDTSATGRWDTDPGTTIASLVVTPIDSDNAALSYSDDYPVSYGDGWLDGLMGGVASLWTATQTSPAPVTMMGEYSPYKNVPHVWTAEIYSYNYLQDNYTTYDGGAYRGFLGGTEIGGSLEGRLIALYIDPDGHRGYLTGSLTGTAYPELEMFEMEGGIYPTEVDPLHTGIAPEDLYDSVWESYSYYYYGNNHLAGKFDNGGTIETGYSYEEGDYWWDDMATMSIVNYEKNKSAPWGIYAQSMFGTYTNPGATWTAKTGGESPFGAYNVANYHYGNYSYADEGSYNYNYYTDDRSGYVEYSRPGGDHYYTHYYGDGTTHTYDYNTGNDTNGRWDAVPETTIASLVGTPIDGANAVLADKDRYGVGEDDYGYWLADISDGTWSGNKLTGKLSGKFITYTKLGTMAGEVLGAYNTTDNTWQAISGGVWSGAPLSFVSDTWADLRATARYYYGSYSYADGGSYSYNYYTDNHDGYVSYDRPGGSHYYTYYYDDGTTYTYDYNTDTSATGRWDTDPGTTIASLVATPPDPSYVSSSSDNYFSNYSGGWLEGLMGGAASLWTATDTSPASVTMIGRYNPYYSNVPHIWNTDIYSYNYKDSSFTTYDGGAYRGYLGGTEIGGSMEGGLLALYIDPSGNAGYLKGSLTGTAYPEIEMFEMEGGLYPVQMVADMGILPADLYNAISVTNETWGTVNDFKFNSTAMGPDSGRDYNYYEDSAKIGSSNWWGIWNASIDGVYEGISVSDNWNWSMEYRDGNKVIGHETTGTQWSNNKIAGADAGYWAEISSVSAVTGISVGETRGTFDPNASTLQAVSMGVWLETNKFLEMAATNPAALQKLNIPAVEVGRATLAGSGNGFTNLNMTDVIFFANSVGNAPKIWATGNVSGSYTATPAIGTDVNLTGGGLSATFTPQVWNTTDNKWLSTVNGTGGFNGSTVFLGAGAGTIAPAAGTISGTAAGVAK